MGAIKIPLTPPVCVHVSVCVCVRQLQPVRRLVLTDAIVALP